MPAPILSACLRGVMSLSTYRWQHSFLRSCSLTAAQPSVYLEDLFSTKLGVKSTQVRSVRLKQGKSQKTQTCGKSTI